MNRSKVWTQRLVLSFGAAIAGITFARATPDETPCGMVSYVGKGAQIIPVHGAVQTKFILDMPVNCGSMIITHEDAFWVKLSDQANIKIAPKSFVEIQKSDSGKFHLYRGQVFLAAAPGINTETWTTPNSDLVFKGGVALLQYDPEARVSTASSFNRDVEFRNKFNEDAKVNVRVGEMSHLAIQEASVNPSQPAVMDHVSVNATLTPLKLSESDQTELVASVKRVYDDRAKSLVTEIAEWNGEKSAEKKDETEENHAESKASRSLASVKGVAKPVKAIDEKEAEFANDNLKKRLDRNEVVETAEVVNKNSRKPASASQESTALVDREEKKQKENFKRETKRLEKEIGTIRDDAEE